MAQKEFMQADDAVKVAYHTGEYRGIYSDEYANHEEFMRHVEEHAKQEAVERTQRRLTKQYGSHL